MEIDSFPKMSNSKKMSRHFSYKFPVQLFVLVLLLNPLVGLAGMLSPLSSGSDLKQMAFEQDEKCHEAVDSKQLGPAIATEDTSQDQSACCEEACACEQGGCYSTSAALSSDTQVRRSASNIFQSVRIDHQGPVLSSSTPPPIS